MENNHEDKKYIFLYPIGTHWNRDNWSCAYDSLFFILFNTIIFGDVNWKTSFYSMNNKSQYISNLIYRCQHNQESIEII